MAKTKKLDIFNLFYSGAAVVILIGVIAKLLEWPLQDLLITGGLAIEALVFAVSAIKFVDVKKVEEGATEATLSKVADGLGDIAANSVRLGNSTSGSASNNLQLKLANQTVPVINENKISVSDLTEKNVVIDSVQPFQTSISVPSANNSHTLWQLEQMDIISLAKDLFFQPKWDELLSDEYNQLSLFFKRVFDKKLPNKEALPFLLQFPIKLPIPELNKLSIDKSHVIEISDIELLCKAFKLINYNNFFENFILESVEGVIKIRPKKSGDIQVYGGENEAVLSHVIGYHSTELVVSPKVECLHASIKLKGELLIDYLIQKIDINNEPSLGSLNILLQPQSDELKSKLWSKFKKIRFNKLTNDGYSHLKLIVQSVISYTNLNIGRQIFEKLIEFQISDSKSIILNDVINFSAETIYFGAKNEYSVNLNELFLNDELENLGHVNSIIEKLIADNIAPKTKLYQIFNLNEHDSKKEVFDKLNYHLNKTNTSPSGAQLAFVLLYKQYKNS